MSPNKSLPPIHLIGLHRQVRRLWVLRLAERAKSDVPSRLVVSYHGRRDAKACTVHDKGLMQRKERRKKEDRRINEMSDWWQFRQVLTSESCESPGRRVELLFDEVHLVQAAKWNI